MEKTIVLALATGQKRFSASLCKLVEKYAEILASQGLLTTAMEYLKLLGSEELSPELTILKDRIALSTEPGKKLILDTMGCWLLASNIEFFLLEQWYHYNVMKKLGIEYLYVAIIVWCDFVLPTKFAVFLEKKRVWRGEEILLTTERGVRDRKSISCFRKTWSIKWLLNCHSLSFLNEYWSV